MSSMLERLEAPLRMLPPPVKRAGKALMPAIDPALRARYRRRTGDDRPMPPMLLRSRVGSGIRPEVFNGQAWGFLKEAEALLRAQGTSLGEQRVVYDWGCGCGKLLRLMDRFTRPDAQIMGSDVDPEAVAWARSAWPHMTLTTNGFTPPLPVEAGAVDCLISSSILTHLSEPDQDSWLEEIRRVLAPDGLALITVCGPAMLEASRNGEHVTRTKGFVERLREVPDLDGRGFLFLPYDRGASEEPDFPGIHGEYGLTFHAEEYVREHWGPWLTLLGRAPAAVNWRQDLLLLRRTA